MATLVALCSAPVIASMLGILIHRERPTPAVFLALACALVGTLLLVRVDASQTGSAALIGVMFSVISGGLYAVVTLVGRKLGSASHAHPLQTTLFGFAFGACILFAIASLVPGTHSGLVLTYPASSWLRLIYLGAFPTAIAYGLFYTGMQTTSSTVASIATFMEPLTATILAVILFNERLAPLTFIGGLLLISAMLLLLRENRALS